MAILHFSNPKITINGVDLSDHCTAVSIDYGAAMLDATAAGADTEINKAGLKKWSMEFTLQQDFAGGKCDATLFPLIGAAAVTVTAQPVNAAESATNPIYTGSAVLETYEPIKGQIGPLLMTRAVFRSAGTLTQDTTP